MGEDKLRLEVGTETLVERVVGVLAKRCDEVILAGPGDPTPPGARPVGDARPGQGPLAGMEAALAAARHPLTFVAAGDMPFLDAGLVGHLLEALERGGASAVVPEHGGRVHPLCAAYSRAVLADLAAALDDGVRAARDFLGRLDRVLFVEEGELRKFGEPDLLLMNVNSREDLRRARGLIGA